MSQLQHVILKACVLAEVLTASSELSVVFIKLGSLIIYTYSITVLITC